MLILKEACPRTNYVTATFHPTIGQCAHQSLRNIVTLELGMISTRNKGARTHSHIAKEVSEYSQEKIAFWFIKLLRRSKGWIVKLISSTIELWTPTQDLAWISQHLHTRYKEEYPSLLQCPSVYSFPSYSLQGMQERITNPSWSLYEVPLCTWFINPIIPSSTPMLHTKQGFTKQQNTKVHTTTNYTC